jgi:hypothetical protein
LISLFEHTQLQLFFYPHHLLFQSTSSITCDDIVVFFVPKYRSLPLKLLFTVVGTVCDRPNTASLSHFASYYSQSPPQSLQQRSHGITTRHFVCRFDDSLFLISDYRIIQYSFLRSCHKVAESISKFRFRLLCFKKPLFTPFLLYLCRPFLRGTEASFRVVDGTKVQAQTRGCVASLSTKPRFLKQ